MSAIAKQRVIRFILNMNAVGDRGMLDDLLQSWSDEALQGFAEMIVESTR
jgi:hypothetical protein